MESEDVSPPSDVPWYLHQKNATTDFILARSPSGQPYLSKRRRKKVETVLSGDVDRVAESMSNEELMALQAKKNIVFVRVCQKETGDSLRSCAARFTSWHTPEWRARKGMLCHKGGPSDPCLSELGYEMASRGPELRGSQEGFAGSSGGLHHVIAAVRPQLILCSPATAAIQTAMVAAEDTDIKILVHPALKTCRTGDLLTSEGNHPEGNPRYLGLTGAELREALKCHPKGKDVDLQHIGEGSWFDVNARDKERRGELNEFQDWLRHLEEKSIVVVTHDRVIRRLVGTKVGHGQCARAVLGNLGQMFSASLFQHQDLSYCHSSSTEDESDEDGDIKKMVLVVRHCQDEEYENPERELAEQFAEWHSDELRAENAASGKCRDPVLTEIGVMTASCGISPPELRLKLNKQGYGGPPLGLQSIIESFQPDIVLTSPMARTLQTAMIMTANTKSQIICNASLKEISKQVKPGSMGIPKSELQKALSTHPEGHRVDLSQLEEVWCDPFETREHMKASIASIPSLLLSRPESRIVVVSHGGVCKKLLKSEMGHGQYVVAEVHDTGKLVITEWSPGVQPYVSAFD